MSRIVIAGGTGFIGTPLVAVLFAQDHDVVILTRKTHFKSKAKVVHWHGNIDGVDTWMSEIDGADAVINLSGTDISVPWTDANKKKIRDSRIEATDAIGEAISRASTRPPVWINMSAVGFYGNRREQQVDETMSRGPGYLSDICVAWEEVLLRRKLDGVRIVALRAGMVLGPGGGAYRRILKLANSFLGGAIGDGKQWVSWIHLVDLISMIQWLITANVRGPVNAVSPNPVRNNEFMHAFRKTAQKPFAIPVPKFMLKLNNKFGGPDPSLALDSIRAVPKVALGNGFEFQFPVYKEAMEELSTP